LQSNFSRATYYDQAHSGLGVDESTWVGLIAIRTEGEGP
jgi:hypothetical protein